LFPFDYISEIIQDAISELPLRLQVLIILLVLVVFSLFVLTKKFFGRWVKSHRKELTKLLAIVAVILIICIVVFSTFNYFCFPKPPEDQLVVAISPFYYTDESGKHGDDINTADDFEERIRAEKDLEIKVVRLDNPIRDEEDAKTQGKRVGAHLVLYGETKSKIGEIVEIKCHVLPLPSLEILPSEMPPLGVKTEDEGGLIITEKATFSVVTEEPITIIESLTQNISSSVYLIGAFENYKKSNFTSAITFFASVKDYENDPSILFYIGNCYYYNNNLNESVQYFDKSIEIKPHYAVAWNNKGLALSGLGRYEDEMAAYEKAIEIKPQYAVAWNNKGLTLYNLDRYEEAIAAFDEAIKIDPLAEVWCNKGAALYNLGRYGEAIVAYDKAIEICPRDAAAWYAKGNALHNLGRYGEAIVAYDKAIEIDPQLAVAWYNKGAALGNLGRYEEAKEAFEKTYEIDPTIEIPSTLTVNSTPAP